MSFVMLTESQVVPPPDSRSEKGSDFDDHSGKITDLSDEKGLLSYKTETATRLFEILSSRSDVDHPICTECTELLVEGLQKRLNSAIRERDAYVEFLRQANTDVPSEEDIKQAQNELRTVREKEEAAFAELEKFEREKAAMEEDMLALDAESQELGKEEEAFWRERNAFTVTLSAFQNERDRVNSRYDHDSKQLLRLQRTNVYNDTFNIGHDGYFGTINGLRLGRLQDRSVDWAEINAAWGQTCLLLATVAEKLGYTFQGYRLSPMGSTSTIERLEYPQTTSANDPSHPVKPRVTVLELYCTGDLPLGLGFLHRRFDNAMVAFLDCLRQLGEYVEHVPAQGPDGNVAQGLRMPYEIRKDKIHDASIKLGGFNQEEQWTKACKYTLTCCKFLLAHASNIHGSARRGV